MNTTALAQTTIQLLILRSSPAQFPASPALLAYASILYLAVGAWLYQALAQAPYKIGLDLLVLIGLLYALLSWRRRENRLVQTLTAFLLCSSVVMIAAAPALLSAEWSASSTDPALTPVASYYLVAIMVWELLIWAHLLRCALSITLFSAAVMALMMSILSVVVGDFLSSSLFGANGSESSMAALPIFSAEPGLPV